MIKKKICMLGSFAVGKTSLVQRFVSSLFSDKYHTTIGVKIDKKIVDLDGTEVNLMLWDIHGEDEYQKIQASYLIGASGYFIVIDGTRKGTIKVAENIQQFVVENIGQKPFIALINKSDLVDEWDIGDDDLDALKAQGWEIIKTSAKTGLGVENAFGQLARKIIE
jgi:small GTP-binding protein